MNQQIKKSRGFPQILIEPLVLEEQKNILQKDFKSCSSKQSEIPKHPKLLMPFSQQDCLTDIISTNSRSQRQSRIDELNSSNIFDYSKQSKIEKQNNIKQEFHKKRAVSQLRQSMIEQNPSTQIKLELRQRKQTLDLSEQKGYFDLQQTTRYKRRNNRNRISIRQILSNKLFQKFKLTCIVIVQFLSLFLAIKKKSCQLIKNCTFKQQQSQRNRTNKLIKLNYGVQENDMIIYKNWVKPTLQKILYYMKKQQHSFIKPNEQNREQITDLKVVWLVSFIKFLLQNLELITRNGNIPRQIIEEMSQIMKRKNSEQSLYVAKRTKLNYNQMKTSEFQLVSSEFVIFKVFINAYCQISNETIFETAEHCIECKTKLYELISFIQLLYMKYFNSLPKNQNIEKHQLIQQIITISKDDKQYINIISSEEIDNSEILILGLKREDHFESIIKYKANWYKNMIKLFDKIIQNIYSQIEATDVE